MPSPKPQPALAAVQEHRSKTVQRMKYSQVTGAAAREWGQFGPSSDTPTSVAAKEEGLGHERIQPQAPAAGNCSKEEWEQPSSTLVGPGNVAVRNEGSRNKRPDKQREDEQNWERVIPKREAAQSAGSVDERPNQDSTESAG